MFKSKQVVDIANPELTFNIISIKFKRAIRFCFLRYLLKIILSYLNIQKARK